jgi:hypothetical protein
MRKFRFDEINKIVIDTESKRVLRSNHPQYKPGSRLDENLMFNRLGRGWEVVRKRNDRPLVEDIAVEDLINNVILPDESEYRFSVFSHEKDENAIFAQTRNGKVFAMDEEGEEKWFDSVEAFLKSLPEGFYLAGQVEEDDIEMEDSE